MPPWSPTLGVTTPIGFRCKLPERLFSVTPWYHANRRWDVEQRVGLAARAQSSTVLFSINTDVCATMNLWANLVQRGQHLLAKPGCYPDIRTGCDFANQQFGLVKGNQARTLSPDKDT
jgi:hypothetical protein